MKCNNCGGDIKPGSKFCEFCGSTITVEMQKEQEQLNKKGCPSCGSTNITFSRENQGEKRDKKGTKVMRQTVGVCKDCGYTWNAPNEEEGKKKRKTWLWVLGWIFIFPLPLTILMLRPTNKLDKRIRYGIIAVAWLIYIIWLATNNGGKNDKSDNIQPVSSVEYEKEWENLASTYEEELEASVTSISEMTEVIETVETEESVEVSEEEIDGIVESETESDEETDSDSIFSSEVDPDLKEFLDSYEEFMDKYIEFAENYDSSDFAMLKEYAELLAKASDFAEKAEKCDTEKMSPIDAAYYVEVMTRINYKLTKVAYGMN